MAETEVGAEQCPYDFPEDDIETGSEKPSNDVQTAAEKLPSGLTEGSSASRGEASPHPPGTFGRGIVSDLRTTVLTWWVPEMINFNQKTVAVSFFLFFACIAPAITFGAMYAKFTGNWIGPVEMIAASAWVGITYSLIGGQPIMINGGTGPVLAFTAVLFTLSEAMDVPFLTFNAWVGIWLTGYLVIAAFLDLNRFMHYATRFTDDVFSGLISAIFIINAIGSFTSRVGVLYYFDDALKEGSHVKYAEAFLSLFLCLGTTWLAIQFQKVKRSNYFPNQFIRTTIADFSVVAAVLIFVLIDQVLFKDITTEALKAPNEFAPTFQCCDATCTLNWPDDCAGIAEASGRRPWLVDIFDLNGQNWVPFFAAVPALLAFVLVFLDNGITWHLINRPENKLTHGSAYNWDTIVIALTILANSFLGLPWLVAATVRSMNHMFALADKDDKGQIKSVQQTRLTNLLIHVLVLVSIFAMETVKKISMPILYGVFLYMGIMSLGSNQFVGRVMMFFQQPSKYQKKVYTERVSIWKMHKFTAIQLGLFVLMYVVKSVKSIAIAFPLVIAACIPIRVWILPKFFSKEELIYIDGDDAQIERQEKLLAKKQSLYKDQGKRPSALYPTGGI